MPDLSNRLSREEDAAAAILAVLQDRRDQWSTGRMDPLALSREVGDALAPVLAGAFAASADDTADQLDMAVAGTDQAARVWSGAYAPAVGLFVAGAVNRSLARASGAEADIAKQLATLERWSRTAATEITRAATAGGEYVASTWLTLRGLLVASTWTTSADARVCPICAPLDGMDKSVWQRFVPNGPPAHWSCRCWLDYSYINRN